MTKNPLLTLISSKLNTDHDLVIKFIQSDLASRKEIIRNITLEYDIALSAVDIADLANSPEIFVDDIELSDNQLSVVSAGKGGHSHDDRSVSISGNLNNSSIYT